MPSGFTVLPATYSAHLDVGHGHRVFYEQRGNIKTGIPVVVVHGGPGGHTAENQLAVFDPEKYHIVSFDQRGCGQSMPKGELLHNTTDDLLQDMETLRQHLKINRWVVAGDSWGSALGLLYAQAHRRQTLGLLLRGVFLARLEDVKAFLSPDGIAATRYPAAWERFVGVLPAEKRENMDDILSAFQEKFDSDDYLPALYAWNRWEIQCSVTPPLSSEVLDEMERDVELETTKIELAYIRNQFYLNKGVLDNITALKGLRVYISQGTYDWVCPKIQAETLSEALNALPGTTYVTSVYVPYGHAGGAPEMLAYKMQAANRLAEQLLTEKKQCLLTHADKSTLFTRAPEGFKVEEGCIVSISP